MNDVSFANAPGNGSIPGVLGNTLEKFVQSKSSQQGAKVELSLAKLRDLNRLDDCRRNAYLNRIKAVQAGIFKSIALTPLIAEVAASINDPVPPSWRSVLRWALQTNRPQSECAINLLPLTKAMRQSSMVVSEHDMPAIGKWPKATIRVEICTQTITIVACSIKVDGSDSLQCSNDQEPFQQSRLTNG